MKKGYLIFVFLFQLGLCTNAQILTFEFAEIAGNEETIESNSNNPHIESSIISRGNGLNASANGDRFNATNWGIISIEQSISDENYMEFSITPNTGYEFSIDSIYFQFMRSNEGPIQMVFRSSEDNFGSNLDQIYAIADNTNQQTFTFTFSQTSNHEVIYRIYMYAESNAGSGGIGDKAGDDIIVYGSVAHINSSDQIIIARNCDPNSNYAPDRYAEIYNAGDLALDITGWKLENIQNNTVAFSWTFSGSIAAGETWVCARANATGQTISPDVTATWSGDSWNGTGGDGTVLKDASANIKDFAVLDGTASDNFENGQMKRKLDVVISSNSFNDDEWSYVATVSNANDLLPGEHGTVWANKNTNWGTDSNWDNLVPTETTDAFIVAGDDIPNLDVNGVSRNLTIKSGALLTVPAGKTLTVNGTLTNEAGTSGLVLKSDAAGASSLLHQTDDVSATVESYFADLNEYYLVSSPISNATANVFFGDYLAYWDEVNGVWMNIYDEETALTVGGGYSLKKVNDHTATYEGLLNNGDIEITGLNWTDQSATYGDGWNLIGNPFPSVLDFSKVDVSGTSIIAGASVWVHGSTNEGSYISYSQGTGVNEQARFI